MNYSKKIILLGFILTLLTCKNKSPNSPTQAEFKKPDYNGKWEFALEGSNNISGGHFLVRDYHIISVYLNTKVAVTPSCHIKHKFKPVEAIAPNREFKINTKFALGWTGSYYGILEDKAFLQLRGKFITEKTAAGTENLIYHFDSPDGLKKISCAWTAQKISEEMF